MWPRMTACPRNSPLAMRGYRCREIHEENGEMVRITIEDAIHDVQDIQAILERSRGQSGSGY